MRRIAATPTAFYEFTAKEVDLLEAATNELEKMTLEAAQHIIDHQLYDRMGIPDNARPLIERSWEARPPSLYGRFDFAYDGSGPPKLLEYEADTPTSLVEAAVAQQRWLRDTFPKRGQFNSIHERLVARWKELAPSLPGGGIDFCSMDDAEGGMTVAYLRDTARQAGLSASIFPIDEIGWNGATFVRPYERGAIPPNLIARENRRRKSRLPRRVPKVGDRHPAFSVVHRAEVDAAPRKRRRQFLPPRDEPLMNGIELAALGERVPQPALLRHRRFHQRGGGIGFVFQELRRAGTVICEIETPVERGRPGFPRSLDERPGVVRYPHPVVKLVVDDVLRRFERHLFKLVGGRLQQVHLLGCEFIESRWRRRDPSHCSPVPWPILPRRKRRRRAEPHIIAVRDSQADALPPGAEFERVVGIGVYRKPVPAVDRFAEGGEAREQVRGLGGPDRREAGVIEGA